MSRKQSRSFAGVTYLSPDKVKKLFESKLKCGVIRSYAFAFHDLDVLDDGSPKVAHLHFILRLVNPSTDKTVLNWFSGQYGVDDDGVCVNTLIEYCSDVRAMFRYLTHQDDPDKYQYDSSIIVCSNVDDFTTSAESDTSFYALEMLLQDVPLYRIAQILGRDFIYHYSHLRTLADAILDQKAQSETKFLKAKEKKK